MYVHVCHGPMSSTAGVEPWSYYIVNGVLNFNVVFLLVLIALPLVKLEVRLLWLIPIPHVAFIILSV